MGRAGRVLLVAYHFPPALTAGALRWQKLIPLLAARGWCFDVLTTAPAASTPIHPDPFRDLPSTTRVFGIAQPQSWIEKVDRRRHPRAPARFGGARQVRESDTAVPAETVESLPPDAIRWTMDRDGVRRAYGALLVHERERAWARNVVAEGLQLLRATHFSLVISSGPPHGAHLGASRLARAAGAPLVTDFRDPWATRRRLPEAYASPLYFAMANREQRRVLDASSLVTATTDAIATSLRDAGARCPVITVMNGSDEEVFRSPPRDRFVITYAGALYLDRDPRSLFRAVTAVVRRTGATPDEIEIRLIGEVARYAGRSITALADEAGVGAYLRVENTMPRAALARHLAESSVLVSFPQDSPFAVPSKLFEYMAYEAWLLVLAAPETPSAQLLTGTDAAVVRPGPDDVDRIADVLTEWFARFRAGARPGLLRQRDRFSRRAQADRLAEAIEGLRQARGAGPR